LLYELLTDQRPYKLKTRSQSEISKAICEQQPDRPSTALAKKGTNSKLELRVSKILKGDLDNIVLKALRKEPEDRYVSVDQFSTDIRRYLEGLPVRARKVTAAYRASKFIRRYKFSVAIALLFVLALIAGTIATSWEAHVARIEKARAERRFEQVRRIANSLMFEFHNSIKDLPGSLAARQLVTRRALEYLDNLAQEAGSDLSLKGELAAAYSKIGLITFDVQQAIDSHRKAVTLNESLVAAAPSNPAYIEQLADSYGDLSDVMKIAGNSAESIAYARKSLAIEQSPMLTRQSNIGERINLAHRYLALGTALRDPGQVHEALANDLQAMHILEKAAKRAPSDEGTLHALAGVYGELVVTYDDMAENSSALGYAHKQLDVATKLLELEPASSRYRRDMWSADFHLATEEMASGNVNDAIVGYTKAVDLIQQLSSADPTDTGHRRWLAVTYLRLADARMKMNELDQAAQDYRKAIDITEKLIASDPQRFESRRDLIRMYESLSNRFISAGDNKRAMDLLNRALSLAKTISLRDAGNTRVRAVLAKVYDDLGKLYRRMADEKDASPATRTMNLRSASDAFQHSLDIWHELQISGKLLPADTGRSNQTETEMVSVRTALK